MCELLLVRMRSAGHTDVCDLCDVSHCVTLCLQVGPPHWLRNGQLVAGVVDEEGGLRVWWATLGRHPSLYHWEVSPTLNLLGVVPPPRHAGMPPAVRAAALCTSSPGCITAALITAGQPHAITVATVSGNPTLPHVPGQEMKLRPAAVIPLFAPGPSPGNLCPAAVAVCPAPPTPPALHALPGTSAPSPPGVHVYILASSTCSMGGTADPGSTGSTSYLLKYEKASAGDEPAPTEVADDFLRDDDDLVFGSAAAALTPAGEFARASAPGAPARHGVAASGDGSKVLMVAGSELRVLDAATFEVLLSQPVPPSQPATAAGSSASQGGPTAAFSSSSACVTLCSPVAVPPAAGVGPNLSGSSSATACLLQVTAVPECPNTSQATLLQQQQGPNRERAISAAAALDAARIVWAGLGGGDMWDVAARCAAAGSVTGGAVPLAVNELLDGMTHTEVGGM